MKKAFSLLLALVMCLSLFACGASPANGPAENNDASAPTPTEDEAPAIPEAAIPEQDIDTSNVTAFASSSEEFLNAIGALVTLDHYDIDETNDGGYWDGVDMSLEYEYTHKCNFDYRIDFSDGSSITLPVSFEEMSKSGWTTEVPSDYMVSNKVQRGIPYTNQAGEEITLWTTNLDPSDADVAIPLSSCVFYGISFDLYEETDTFELLDSAPKFSLCGGITQASSIKDVISALGEPDTIDYYVDGNGVKLYYNEKLTNWYSSISFDFDDNGKYITSAKYEYSYADIT